jgi:predicted transcriptional regulator of viral defense system
MKEHISTLSDYIDSLRRDGQYHLSRRKAIEGLNMSDHAFKSAAYRLGKKGSLKRVRGDFFIIIPPEHEAIGSLPAAWFIDDLMHYLKQSYYVALLTAAALHGAAHQQPMTFQVITDKKTRDITIGQVSIKFSYKKHIFEAHCQQKKTVTGQINISSSEMTAFDLVKYMNASGQVHHVATVLSELVEFLDPERLSEIVKNNDCDITSAQRLGYLLEALKLPFDLRPLEHQLNQKKKSRRLLVVSSQEPIIDYNKRWHIEVNEKLEPDDL